MNYIVTNNVKMGREAAYRHRLFPHSIITPDTPIRGVRIGRDDTVTVVDRHCTPTLDRRFQDWVINELLPRFDIGSTIPVELKQIAGIDSST